LVIAARAEGLLPPGDSTTTIVALPVTPDQVLAAAQLARDLRAAGFVVVFDASDRKLDKRLKNADRHGATICCLIGEDEAAAGTVTLRDLTSRSQTTVPQSDAVAALRASAVPQGVSR